MEAANDRRFTVRNILLTATALALLSCTAYAVQTSTSGSASNATNTSGSQSSSVSSPRVTVSGNTVGNGNSASNSGAKASANTRSNSRASANPTLTSTTATNVYIGDPASTGTGATTGSTEAATNSAGGTTAGTSPTTANLNTNYSGSYTVRNTPEVIAPNVVGGNPCAVGASGGVALPGFGLSAGTTWADKACERRQQAALMFNMGEPLVARELMCQDEQVRMAMKSASKPCVADTVVGHAQPPNTLAQPATSQASAPEAALPATPAQARTVPAKPEWCGRASPSTEASRAYFLQACT
jgi:hypothetical protein